MLSCLDPSFWNRIVGRSAYAFDLADVFCQFKVMGPSFESGPPAAHATLFGRLRCDKPLHGFHEKLEKVRSYRIEASPVYLITTNSFFQTSRQVGRLDGTW